MTQIDQGWLRYYIGRSLRKKAAAPFREPSHVTECSLSRRTWLSKRSFDDLIKICLELDYDKVISVKIANLAWSKASNQQMPQNWRRCAIELIRSWIHCLLDFCSILSFCWSNCHWFSLDMIKNRQLYYDLSWYYCLIGDKAWKCPKNESTIELDLSCGSVL